MTPNDNKNIYSSYDTIDTDHFDEIIDQSSSSMSSSLSTLLLNHIKYTHHKIPQKQYYVSDEFNFITTKYHINFTN